MRHLTSTVLLLLLFATATAQTPTASPTRNEPADGYRGVWYFNQKSDDEYVYKYSGGLGTYCAKHQPFAVHCASVDKTFFCYGGTTAERPDQLLHMVSYYDHATGTVPRPTILLDKQTNDAHDNPVLAVDGTGHVWIFSTSHGRTRPSFVHRSARPYDVREFVRVEPTFVDERGERRALDNFSYFQAWHAGDDGFLCFFTRYGAPAARTSMFLSSADGVTWSARRRLAAIEKGHYQISGYDPVHGTAAAACNFHPDPQGLNWRTNLYYMQSQDGGRTFTDAAGAPLELPLTTPDNAALVRDYSKQELLVYLKDLAFAPDGSPRILFVTSRHFRSGPDSGPRTWRLARFRDGQWTVHDVTTSDHNYDMGSLYVEPADTADAPHRLRIIAPTEPGPQRYNPGGEIAMWTSDDDGSTWRRAATLTENSERNHTYVRRPVAAHPDFYALWADGDARRPSRSHLYFATREGRVFRLPDQMPGEHARPVEVERGR